ncbi:MAG: hypothetical protein KTR31_39240 [Myxococcales bacterium]|nr:hypothetical protein [Myxococcales bacterium]
MTFITWLLACTGPDPDREPGPLWSTADRGTTTTPGTPPGDTAPREPLEGEYNGEIPVVSLAPPTFDGVVNRDASARTQAHLLGQATALWFYPAAFTGG